MKKIIIAAAIVVTTGILATATSKSNTAKTEKITKTEVAFNKSVSLGTAD